MAVGKRQLLSNMAFLWFTLAAVLSTPTVAFLVLAVLGIATGHVRASAAWYPFGTGYVAFFIFELCGSLPFAAPAALFWFLYVRQTRKDKNAELPRQQEEDRQLAEIKLRRRGSIGDNDVWPPPPKVE